MCPGNSNLRVVLPILLLSLLSYPLLRQIHPKISQAVMVKPSKRGCCWNFRNNSSSVAAILQPQFYMPSDSSWASSVEDRDEEVPPEERYCLGDNNCYCKEKPTRPRLFLRPRSCIFGNGQTLGRKDTVVSKTDTKSCVHGNNSRFFDDFQNSTLKNDQNYDESDRFIASNKRFSGSEDVNKIWGNFNKSDFSKTTSGMKNLEDVRDFRKNNQEFSREESAIPMITTNEETSNFKNTEDHESLKKLNDFRTDHYFETHSTEDLIPSASIKNRSDEIQIPDHKCVHRFGLDERLLPRALNFDVYGTSRCVICGKPMKNAKNHEKDERISGNINSPLFPKYYQYGLVPKNVYPGAYGDDNVEIEMILRQDENLLKKKPQKIDYFNTCALRFQRGVY